MGGRMHKPAKSDIPLTFKDDKEVAEFERMMRVAHSQHVDEEPPKQEPLNPNWLERKAPGIKKKIISLFLPPRSHHMKPK